jgi:uncharacterized protein YacL
MLHLLRAMFILICGVFGAELCRVWQDVAPDYAIEWPYGLIAGSLAAVAIVIVEMFGLVFGFIFSYLFIGALMLIPAFRDMDKSIQNWIQFTMTFVFCYVSVIAILQSKDDFKFVIPFIELTKEHKGVKPAILDSSVIIDGRIADIIETGVIDVPLVLPRFILQEIHTVADSSDKLKRNRGRRGLDVLNRMQKSERVEIQINDATFPYIEGNDAKLIRLAKSMSARILTNDFNLNKVAQLQGVEIINVNDIANAMKAVFLPGEVIAVKIVKPGEQHGQGVGYLDDGTMIVVDGGYSKIGEKVNVNVTSILQTSAGRMIFGALGDGK